MHTFLIILSWNITSLCTFLDHCWVLEGTISILFILSTEQSVLQAHFIFAVKVHCIDNESQSQTDALFWSHYTFKLIKSTFLVGIRFMQILMEWLRRDKTVFFAFLWFSNDSFLATGSVKVRDSYREPSKFLMQLEYSI